MEVGLPALPHLRCRHHASHDPLRFRGSKATLCGCRAHAKESYRWVQFPALRMLQRLHRDTLRVKTSFLSSSIPAILRRRAFSPFRVAPYGTCVSLGRPRKIVVAQHLARLRGRPPHFTKKMRSLHPRSGIWQGAPKIQFRLLVCLKQGVSIDRFPPYISRETHARLCHL